MFYSLFASTSGGGFNGLTYPAGMEPATIAVVVGAAAAGILGLTLGYTLGFRAIKKVVGKIFASGS